MSKSMRLQVYLSHSGVCSRRKAMDFVKNGQVSVNNKIVMEPSTPVTVKDRVTLNGKPVSLKEDVTLVLNKPVGYVTTKSDKHAEKTIVDLLPSELSHLNSAGRLDKDTQGLLILSNNGDLINALTHPRYVIDKVYEVKVKGFIKREAVKQLERGLYLDGRKTAPAKITNVRAKEKESTFFMTIHEGRNRQIRRMTQKIGHRVIELKRLQQGPVKLGKLRPGEFRPISARESSALAALKNPLK